MDISKDEALQLCQKWKEEGTKVRAIFETSASVVTVSIVGRVQIDATSNMVLVSDGAAHQVLCAIKIESVERFEYKERREIPTKSLEGWDSHALEALLAFYGYDCAWQCGFFEVTDL
jgi:hypothetical protein